MIYHSITTIYNNSNYFLLAQSRVELMGAVEVVQVYLGVVLARLGISQVFLVLVDL